MQIFSRARPLLRYPKAPGVLQTKVRFVCATPEIYILHLKGAVCSFSDSFFPSVFKLAKGFPEHLHLTRELRQYQHCSVGVIL